MESNIGGGDLVLTPLIDPPLNDTFARQALFSVVQWTFFVKIISR